MARVTISKALMESVTNKLGSFRNKELSQLKNPTKNLTFAANEPFIQEYMWEGRLDLQNLLPQSWLNNNKHEVGFKFNCEDKTAVIGWYESDAHVTIDFSTHPIPNHMACSRQVIKVSSEVSARYGMDKLITLKNDRDAIVERYSKVREDVVSFLNKCKSLNEALKLWPAIYVYVGEEFVQKAQEIRPKNERRVSEAMNALSQIDVDAVQATAVAARLADT